MSFGSFPLPQPTVFNGIEIDMLSLGDADCLIVTKYENGTPHRILIDGGSGKSADVVIDFMLRRKVTELWAAICTHAHKDHARGLVKIVQDNRIKIHTATFNDIRHYISADALRRASDDGVKEVLETTKELSAAFTARNIPIYRGLAGDQIAKWPKVTVLGPSLDFYKRALEDFTKVDMPIPFSSLGSILGGSGPSPVFGLSGIRAPYPNIFAPPQSTATLDISSLLAGALSRSSVKEEPKTQPFNNTSMILGMEFAGRACCLQRMRVRRLWIKSQRNGRTWLGCKCRIMAATGISRRRISRGSVHDSHSYRLVVIQATPAEPLSTD